jgi:AcrR family transcriptional regulator
MDLRERIIEGAAGLFKTYGIKSVTMDSLAGHLGMSKRTIYEVFADKDELLYGVLQWMANRQKDLVKRVLDSSDNAIVAIFKLLEISREHIQDMSPAFQADIRKYHRDVLMKKTDKCEMPDHRNNKAVIERGIKEKLFKSDINPEIVNNCLASIGRSIMDDDLYPFEHYSRKEVIRNTFLNYLRGISTAEGNDLINKLEKNF